MEEFAARSGVPKTATKRTKNMLFLAAHLGASGIEVYKKINEDGLPLHICKNIDTWSKERTHNLKNDDDDNNASKLTTKSWEEIVASLKCNDDKTESALALRILEQPIMKEIQPHLKNKESMKSESLASIYLSLFQPSFDLLLAKNLTTERINSKEKILAIRSAERYKNLKPDAQLLEQIFEIVN